MATLVGMRQLLALGIVVFTACGDNIPECTPVAGGDSGCDLGDGTYGWCIAQDAGYAICLPDCSFAFDGHETTASCDDGGAPTWTAHGSCYCAM